MKLEVGLKLKKTLKQIDEMPHSEFITWLAFLITKGEERKKALDSAKAKRRR